MRWLLRKVEQKKEKKYTYHLIEWDSFAPLDHVYIYLVDEQSDFFKMNTKNNVPKMKNAEDLFENMPKIQMNTILVK